MQELSCVEIVGAIGRRPERKAWKAKGVSTDSRTIRHGELFFALKGPRFDGHNFVADAFREGAVAAIVSRPVELPADLAGRPLLQVPDVQRALGDLARFYRRKWGGVVVAITGSNGKTTTKEMLHRILSSRMRVKRSPLSFNNSIGVPATLFQAEAEDIAVVVEMGSNSPGEIDYIASIAEPEIGILTNVTETHLEGLKSVEGVAREKASLLRRLQGPKLAVLNADDCWTSALCHTHEGRSMTFGTSFRADIRANEIFVGQQGTHFKTDKHQFNLSVLGIHNVYNLLAALCVARFMGVDFKTAERAMRQFALPPMRFDARQIAGVTLVNDAYNANVASMCAALRTLSQMGCGGRRLFVCGDMLELGDQTEVLHRVVGQTAAAVGVDRMWCVGDSSRFICEAAATRAGRDDWVMHCNSAEEASHLVADFCKEGDVVLFKGSRRMRMEHVVDNVGRELTARRVG